MADYSQKWHDGSSSRNIDSSSNSEGIAAIVNKLDSLGHDIKKLKENVHAIQVGCQTCGGAHLDKECPLNEEVKSMEEVKYGEFDRPFPNNNRNDDKFNRGASRYDQPSSRERRPSLTKIINKYMEEAAKRHAEQDEWLKKLHQNTETNREAHDKIIQDLEMKVRTLTNEVEGRANGDFNNALADLGASISVMPLSMYKCLGIGKLQPINMVIEMADNTKCTPKGIVENLLKKINKFIFSVDFVILDMVEDFRIPIILGRPLLATAHAKIDIFRMSISLEVGNEKVIFKMRSSFTTIILELVRSIKSKTCPGDDDFKKINYDLFLYDSKSCEFNRLLGIDPDIFSYEIKIHESYEEIVYRITEVDKETYSTPKEKRVHWCKAILQEKENERQYWASCYLNSNVCDGVVLPINEEKRYWESINDSKREEEKFKEEEDDIEENSETPEEWGEDKANTITGAIHDKLNDDWFKEEIYTKVKVLEIDEMPRTRDNVASIRARLMEKMANEGNDQAKTFSQQGIGIRGLLDSFTCGKKVLSGLVTP
ncbi:zinc knuckle CX2CX4HX4C containing protein [Tanacetum coccineum]